MNEFYSLSVNRMHEGIDHEKFVIATYAVSAKKGVDQIVKAASIGVEQSTGSWVHVPGETEELKEASAAKVVAVYEYPDMENVSDLTGMAEDVLRNYVMKIAFPIINFKDNLPLMMSSVLGNIAALPNLKLIDLEFPKSFTATFKGPKFGIQGVRDLLGVHGRPFLNNMIKPCTGYTPEEGAKLFYEAAVGGVDIIKDDELISGDTEFNKIEDRVKAYMARAEEANAIKNEKTLYAVNITDEVSRLKENAIKAIRAGANCIMVNAVGTGLSGLRMLAEDPEINVPIMAHACGGGIMFTSPYNGMSSNLLYKLIRLCGADIVVNSSPYGKFDILKTKYIKTTISLKGDFYDIKPSLPLYGGGIIPGVVEQTLDDSGIDCILGVGAGVHAHPDGPRAGGVAMRQAIDAVMNGQDLREASQGKPELEAAITAWGIYGEEKQQDNYKI